MAEHYYQYHNTKGHRELVSEFSDFSLFRKFLIGEVKGLRDIRAMSEAFKHYRLDGHNIDTAGAVHLLTYDGNRIFPKWNGPDYKGRIVIERNDGTELVFGEVLENVVSFWKRVLRERTLT